MSSIDLIVPAAIVGGCLAIILAVLFIRRDRTPRWSIDEPLDEPEPTLEIEPARLADWHLQHGTVVAGWIAAHERVLRRLGDAELAIDRTGDSLFEETSQAAENLQTALAEHPSPVMRAELSAMQVAAEASLHAVRRADYQTAERQHLTYISYRDEWIARLRQFSLDDPELVELRRTLTYDDAVTASADEPPTDGDTDLQLSG